MARIFEVWHTDLKTLKDERYGVYDFLDTALDAIKQNWSATDGEKFSIVERISDFDIKDADEEVDPCYGLEKLTMTVRDLNALLNGKKIYTQINGGEYAIEINYAGNDE
jgi:hypothetical protein